MKKINNKKGFTIVELVIVIAVIGVLAAILIPTFINLNNKAKVANTTSFLKNVNTQIAAKNANPDIDDVVFDKLTGRKTIVTDTDGIVYAQKQGFDIETISPFDGNEIVWDMKNTQFAFVKEGEIDPVYAEAGFSWDNVQKMPETAEATTNALAAGEKVYLRRDLVLAEEITVSNSVDMGSNSSVKKIIYSHTTAPAQTVVIRTNSADVELEIEGYVDPTDSTKGDVIYHYGPSGALNIIKCATGSYHEAGKSAFAEISAGRIVFEEGSLIDHLHINKNESTGKFDEVIVKDNGAGALPEKITRDEVEVSVEEGSIDVVTVETKEGVQEVVKVYADGSVGSTEKVTEGENKQNENVNSALGQLVLDNGSESKALDNEAKEDVKEAIVETAQDEEELSDAEESGYEITHHDALEPTCTEDGHTAYDSYFVNAEEQKVGYKVIPATGHHKSDNPSYQHAFSAAHWQHATQCSVCGDWIVENCIDDNHDNECDECGQQMYVLVHTSSDLHTNSKYPSAIWNGAYKLMNNVSLDTMSRIYGDVVIDLNGYTLSNYSINSPADTQFMSYSNANAIYTLTLRDSSISKTGMFMSRFGDTFFDGSGNSGNNRFVLNCEDGVTINTSFNYQGTEMDSFAYTGGYFINNASKDIIIRNAHLVIGGIAHVNSGYTVTFENCVIESRQSSGFLQSGSGNIVYDGCTITTVMQSSSGNVLDSSNPNVTFINGTTVNGVTK